MKRVLVFLAAVVFLISATGCRSKHPIEDVTDAEVTKAVEAGNGTDDVTGSVDSDVTAVEAGASDEGLATGNDLFDDFLAGEAKVKVADGVSLFYGDMDAQFGGSEFTLSELTEAVTYDEFRDFEVEPDISYSRLQKDGGSVLLLNYKGVGIDGYEDDSHAYVVIAERDGGLVLTYSNNSWSRNEVNVNCAGVITGGGSSGAGSHGYEMGFVDSDGEYRNIYVATECFTEWFDSIFLYTYPDFFSARTQELAQELRAAAPDESVITSYKVGDMIYGIFDVEECDELNELMSAATFDGMTILGHEDMQGVIADYVDEMGLSEDEINAEAMEWTVLN